MIKFFCLKYDCLEKKFYFLPRDKNKKICIFQNRFIACQEKLSQFTSMQASFEGRLNRAMGELRNVERNSCILDVLSAGPSNVQDQFQHCLKMYRTLSEIKSEIENVIKTGRKICEDRTTKNPKKLGLSIDALKHLYNALGEHVTQSKNDLEKLLKLSNTLTNELNAVEKWLCMNENSNSPVGVVGDKENNSDELPAIEIEKILEQCNVLYDEYRESCEPIYLEDVRRRIDCLSKRFVEASNADVLKNLNETKLTLHNLDTISIDTLRAMEKDLAEMNTSNREVQKLHSQVLEIVKVSIS